MGLPPADGCSSSRALKLCRYVYHCIPRVWGLLIWTFSEKIDSLPAVSKALLAASKAQADGSEVLSAGFEALSAGFNCC